MGSVQQSLTQSRSFDSGIFELASHPSTPPLPHSPPGISTREAPGSTSQSKVWPPQSHTPPFVLPPPRQAPRAEQKLLTIAVDVEAVIRTEGTDAFHPHGAMALVKKFLRINDAAQEGVPRVEVVLMCHVPGPRRRRLLEGLREAGLPLDRVLFTRDRPMHEVLKPCDAMLYLSCDPNRTRDAVAQGIAAGRVLAKDTDTPVDLAPHTLQISFDFDGVLADDASQRRFDDDGLEAFQAFEEAHRNVAMAPGPAQPLALALGKVRDALRASGPDVPLEMNIAVVTARGSVAIERVLCTLEAWDFDVDDVFCLSGADKTPFISGIKSDLYIDDNGKHAERAKNVTVSVHMPTLASLS